MIEFIHHNLNLFYFDNEDIQVWNKGLRTAHCRLRTSPIEANSHRTPLFKYNPPSKHIVLIFKYEQMRYLLLVLCFFTSVITSAQEGQRYTEDEIARQGLFIKATQKKLLGKLDEAIEVYEQILKKDKSNPVVYFDLSRIYLELGDKDEATGNAEKANKKDPSNLWYQESLAEIYFEFQEYQDAGLLYERLSKNRGEGKYHYFRAQEAYEKANNQEAALNVLAQLETEYGTDSYSIQENTRILLNLQRNKEALNKAGQLLKMYPANTEYLLLNAKLQEQFGSKKKSKQLFEQILRQEPDNSEALVFLARMSPKKDKIAEIESFASKSSVDIDTKVKALIPFAQTISKDHPQKERLLHLGRTLVDVHPDEAKAYGLYGDLLYNSGQTEKAEIEYLKTLDLDKSVFTIWKQVMVIQYQLKKYPELTLSSEKAINYYPNQAYPYVYNGLAHFEQGHTNEASEMLIEANFIGTKDASLKNQIKLLNAKLVARRSGEEIVEMTKEDLFMRNIKSDDERIILPLKGNRFLVRIKMNSKAGDP